MEANQFPLLAALGLELEGVTRDPARGETVFWIRQPGVGISSITIFDCDLVGQTRDEINQALFDKIVVLPFDSDPPEQDFTTPPFAWFTR